MSKKIINNIVRIALILILLSCNNSKNEELKLELDKIKGENKNLENEISLIKNSIEKSKEKEIIDNIENNINVDNDFQNKFVFAVLTVIKNEFDENKFKIYQEIQRRENETYSTYSSNSIIGFSPPKIERFNSIEYDRTAFNSDFVYILASDIFELENFNDDKKYKFLDQVQNTLKNSYKQKDVKTLLKRECLVFNNYADASRARERVLQNPNETYTYKSNDINTKGENVNSALIVVKSFFTYLGERKFYDAYNLTNILSWEKSGGFRWFASTSAYGGISSVIIYDIKTVSDNDNSAIIYIDYYASDPYNTSNRWKQNIYLENKYGTWKIIKLKTL
jgi:hypothetical protein